MQHPSNKRPRVVFMGTPALAATILQGLVDARDTAGAPAYEVVGVWTQPDRRAGRGRSLLTSEVKQLALARGLALLQPSRMKDGTAEQALRALAPDVVVVAAYGRILPQALLAVPRLGCINVHASLLPRWRGASPIVQAILHGDSQTGVSIMQMDAGLDTGPVYCQRALAVAANETAASLTLRLAALGRDALLAALPAIVRGTERATAQPEEGICYAGLLRKEEGLLQFGEDAQTLARKVRAFTPWPTAFLLYAGERVLVLHAHPAPEDDTAYGPRRGEVLAANAKGLRIACGRGSLWLTEVKPAGRKNMPASVWIDGRGPKKGATLEDVTQA